MGEHQCLTHDCHEHPNPVPHQPLPRVEPAEPEDEE